MTDQLKSQLAAALNIQPEDIIAYRRTPDGSYTVILSTYQKRRSIHPAAAQPSDPPPAADPIPANLQSIYQVPMRGTKTQLVELCRLLNIQPEQGATKKQLVKQIDNYRNSQ